MRKTVFCFLSVLCLLPAAFAVHMPDVEISAERVAQALEASAEQQQARRVALESVVNIELGWLSSKYGTSRRTCRGVLVDGGTRVVTHANCFSGMSDKRLYSVLLRFANGYALGGLSMLEFKKAGSFAYWDLFLPVDRVAAAELSVSKNRDISGQLGRSKDGEMQTLSEEQFVFLGKEWELGGFSDHWDEFTLYGALRARPYGEPVFIGRRVVALNASGGAQNPMNYFSRPVFTVFTPYNGGQALLSK